MRGSDDLKNLLDKLKIEVGPVSRPQPETEAPPAAARPYTPPPAAARPDHYNRAFREQLPRPSAGTPQNTPLNENKESMLFGMLASLIATLGGVLAGYDYLVLIGAVVFALFSMVLLLALLRFSFNYKRPGPDASALADRVDGLSRKVEMLSSRAAAGSGGTSASGGQGSERELERKVEELRTLVKSLAKAVDGGR